jgi:hypothetical protein
VYNNLVYKKYHLYIAKSNVYFIFTEGLTGMAIIGGVALAVGGLIGLVVHAAKK